MAHVKGNALSRGPVTLAAYLVPFFLGNALAAVPGTLAIKDLSHVPEKLYLVRCTDAVGSAGTWIPITASTVTTQEAVIPNGAYAGMPNAAALYCYGNDGSAGVVTGAPDSLLLVPGTRISVLPALRLEYPPSKPTDVAQIAIQPTTWLRIDSSATFLMTDRHSLDVYPPNVLVTLGETTYSYYVRPHAALSTPPPSSGCVVHFYKDGLRIFRTERYPDDCTIVRQRYIGALGRERNLPVRQPR